MRTIVMAAAFSALCAAQGWRAEDWPAEIRALRPGDTKAEESAVLDEVQARARRTLDSIPRARTRAEADAARAGLRRELEESLGFRRLPWPPALHARAVGTARRVGYHIEKLVYQTLPGVEVPAHLYIPDGLSAPAPAILFYSGHWWPDSKTRPDFQAFCINMARLGFVVLAWDPFGQGERGMSGRDHRRVESLLVGIAQQGIAEYETRCALEYLLSRREVDAQRIGLTGASGGGYNTWITASLDDRIAVAVPVVGTSDFYEQLSVLRPLDWYHTDEHCHFVPGLMRYANNQELLAMAAPRPLMIIAASVDQSFPIAGVRQVYQYGRDLYASYDRSDRIGFFEDSSAGHGYQQKKREAAYGWFLKWLMGKGDGRAYAEPPTEIPAFDSPELRCFPTGKNEPAGPGIVAAVERLAARIEKSPWPPIEPERACPVEVKDAPAQRLMFCDTPAFLIQAPGKRGGVVIAFDDRGKEALADDAAVRSALDLGWSVLGIDPRGIGERATTQTGWISASSLLLGDYFIRRQAADVLAVMRAFAGRPLALCARGTNAGLIAAFVLNQAPVEWSVVRDGFLSFRQFLDRPKSLEASYVLRTDENRRRDPYDREIPLFYIPFHALERSDLAEMLAKSPLLAVNPVNGDWERMSQPQAQKLLPASARSVVSDAPDEAVRAFIAAHPMR
jgi:dienelactone hydrolase